MFFFCCSVVNSCLSVSENSTYRVENATGCRSGTGTGPLTVDTDDAAGSRYIFSSLEKKSLIVLFSLSHLLIGHLNMKPIMLSKSFFVFVNVLFTEVRDGWWYYEMYSISIATEMRAPCFSDYFVFTLSSALRFPSCVPFVYLSVSHLSLCPCPFCPPFVRSPCVPQFSVSRVR